MKHIFFAFSFLLLTCLTAGAQTHIPTKEEVGAAVCPDAIAEIVAPFDMPQLQRPRFPELSINVAKAGAKQRKLSTKAVQNAIDKLSRQGGGTVIIPKGDWLTGRLILKDNINLHLDEGAVLRFSGDLKDYLPVVYTRNEGIELMSLGSQIYANGARNIAITGKGTLVSCPRETSEVWKKQDENNKGIEERIDWRTPVVARIYDGSAPGKGVHLPMFFAPINCTNVLVEGVTFKDAIYWNITPTYCDSVIIRGVTVDSKGGRTDGIDVESTRNVLIEYCTISSGDDNYTMKAGRCEDGLRVNKPTENVVVRHCLSLKGPGALTIGTETSGMIRNVYCHDCVFESPSNGFYFKTRRTRGGGAENIFADRIRMIDVKVALMLDELGNPQWMGALAERRPLQPVTRLTPIYQNLTLRDVVVEKCRKMMSIKSLGERPANNILLDRWNVTYTNDAPTITDVDGLVLHNSNITGPKDNIVITDSKNVFILDTKINGR